MTDEGISMRQAAQIMNVSVRSVKRARRVRNHGTPELVAMVASGRLSLHAAETLTYLLPEDQRRALALPDKEIKALAARINKHRSANRCGSQPEPQPEPETVAQLADHLEELAEAHGAKALELAFHLICGKAKW